MQANAKLLVTLFFLISFRCWAQKTTTDTLSNPLQLTDAGIYFNWQSNSTALTNKFLVEALTNVVSETSKNNSEKKLSKNNFFVNQIEGGAYYVLPLKSSPSASIIIELAGATYMDARFSKSAFELIMNGNAPYKNVKKEIGSAAFRSINYQKAGIGLRKYSKDKSECINATLNFVVGDQARNLMVERGSIFTEENGEYVDVDLAFDWRTAAEGAKLLQPKGYGASLNFNWVKLLKAKGDLLSLEFRDIGLVHYGAATINKSIDTTVHFSGFDFGTLNAKSTLHDFNLSDSITNKFQVKTTNKAYNFTLPTLFEIRYEHHLNSSSLLSLQGNAYLYNAMPLVKVAYLYRIKNGLHIGTALRVGGYAKLDIDLLARYQSKKVFLDATVRSVEGLIAPGMASGMGAGIRLEWFLN